MKNPCTKIFMLLLAVSLIAFTAAARKGKISGSLRDKNSGEAVIGAIVTIPGSSWGAVSDMDGHYTLEADSGIYTVRVQGTGFRPVEIKDVRVDPNQPRKLDISLEDATKELEGIVVSGKVDRGSETALLLERKQSVEITQKIGAAEMSRKGVSNAAEGLTKMVGVSAAPGKVIVVRGLGDRYNNVTVNGLPVPSTNPDLKVIPLSIFPTQAIRNIAVSKSYAPQDYGDYAGGYIDIVTKDYPEKPFVQVGLSGGANSITTGKHFLATDAGSHQAASTLGFARNNRALPAEVAGTKYYDSKELNANADPFRNRFTPVSSIARPGYGLNIAAGNFLRTGSRGGGFGYYATAGFRNELKYSPGIQALYNAQQSPRYHYSTDNYNYSANATGLLNLVYKMNQKHSIGFTSLYVNDAQDNWIELRGNDNDLGELYSRRNTYIQNTLSTNQLYGKHELSERSRLTWGASYSNTKGSIPDRIQNTFRVLQTSGEPQYAFASDAVSNNHRFFGALTDNEYSGRIEFAREDKERKTGFSRLALGFNGKYKDRDFRSRQIDMKIAGGSTVDPDNVDAAFRGRVLGDGLSSGSYKYVESYYAPNDYMAKLALAAGYLSAAFKTGNWQILGGVRAEYASQTIFYKKGSDTYDAAFRESNLTGVGLMPSLTVKHELSKRSNLMLALSRTITRPQFIEAGPFRYNESFGTQEREGNPLLKNGTNYNLDIKYEWYPSPSELVSVNLLGKYMLDPIELVIVASADPLLTYVNTDEAYIGGVEFEYARNIGKWLGSGSGWLGNSTVGLNAAYLYSQIRIGDPAKLDAQMPVALTNTRRPLMGASPYILNADYAYRHNWNKDKGTYSLFTLTYNIFGRRVFAAGSQGAGDIYEMPVGTLDLTVISQVTKGFSFNVNLGNILNPYIVQKQEFSTGSLEVLKYRRGIDFGLSLAYRFDN